ncbi:MAG: PIN domain-containing protein [Promethearchaeota archaeon]
MKKKICLDTGILTLHFARDCPPKVEEFMKKIKNRDIEAHVLAPVLSEFFFHVCKLDGIEIAKISINSLLEQYPLVVVKHDTSLIVSAGILKCQHRNTLSYIDCMSISYCLNNKLEFHTTEKKVKKIPGNTLQKLRIVKYQY